MKYFALLAIAASLSACGFSTEEYALNRSALAPGVGVVGGSVKDVNPVSGQIVGTGVGAGSGTTARSLANPAYQRHDPYRRW